MSHKNTPFWWIPLLLHLCKDALCLVIDTVRTCGHLPIALDLLFPAHITRLWNLISEGMTYGSGVRNIYPCDSSPLWVIAVFCKPIRIVH
jgi:hypothetical protein